MTAVGWREPRDPPFPGVSERGVVARPAEPPPPEVVEIVLDGPATARLTTRGMP